MEKAPAGTSTSGRAQPARSAPKADARVVELHRSVGNRAVTEAMTKGLTTSVNQAIGSQLCVSTIRVAGNRALTEFIQRLPFAQQPPPAARAEAKEDLKDRLDAATDLAKRPGFLAGAVKELYATKPRRKVDLVQALWDGHLQLKGVDRAKIDDKALKPKAGALWGRLEGGMVSALQATVQAIVAELGGRGADVNVQVATLLKGAPLSFFELRDQLWTKWLGCTSFDDLRADGLFLTGDSLKPYTSVLKEAVSAYATQHFTGEALAELTKGPEKDVVRRKIEGLDHWATPGDLDAFTDAVLAETKTPVQGRTDPAWVNMRGKMANLVVVAEVDIVKAVMPTHFVGGTTAVVWSRARGMYTGTLEKPIWRYYAEDIVPFTVFGKSFDKASGVHRKLLEPLARVEPSAKRLAGSSYQKPDLPRSGGFRFQPQDGKWSSDAHVSLHATGRAVDFDDVHNQYVNAPARQLVGFISGVELSGLGFDRSKVEQIARDLDARHAEKKGLEEKLKGELSDEDKAAAEQRLADVNAGIAGFPDSDQVRKLRDRVGAIYDLTVQAQQAFAAEWQALTNGSGKAADIDMAALTKKLDEIEGKAKADRDLLSPKLADAKKRMDELAAKSKGSTDADLKAKAEAAKQEVDQLAGQDGVLRDRLERLGKARATLKSDKAGTLSELENKVFKAGGLTNLPRWLVLAFVENGFSWGGAWAGASDAMHFSYQNPVEGVSQGLGE